MFKTKEEQHRYIIDNYLEVSDHRIDNAHWDLHCTYCKTTRGFQVVYTAVNATKSEYSNDYYLDQDAPRTIYFRCPVCKGYKQWIIYQILILESIEGKQKQIPHYYRVASLPSEGIEDIEELPVDPPALRIAYRQAIRAMDANAHIAAAAMFRRALQVITRSILGAKPGNLGAELKEVVGSKFNGTTITNDFSEVGYIIKEAGNQGAHPDKDSDLLDFTEEDAKDLQHIFMDLVTDLFVVPEATKRSREDFLRRRKIQIR